LEIVRPKGTPFPVKTPKLSPATPNAERFDTGQLGPPHSSIPAVAARATWKGVVKISLVNIPIKVFPATESSGTISFNQLHDECQTRIQQKRWCPQCNREVPNTEIVKDTSLRRAGTL
jgi:hypothetical protein